MQFTWEQCSDFEYNFEFMILAETIEKFVITYTSQWKAREPTGRTISEGQL
jgi:hypothetical protein